MSSGISIVGKPLAVKFYVAALEGIPPGISSLVSVICDANTIVPDPGWADGTVNGIHVEAKWRWNSEINPGYGQASLECFSVTPARIAPDATLNVDASAFIRPGELVQVNGAGDVLQVEEIGGDGFAICKPFPSDGSDASTWKRYPVSELVLTKPPKPETQSTEDAAASPAPASVPENASSSNGAPAEGAAT